jgi:hypothetical protein
VIFEKYKVLTHTVSDFEKYKVLTLRSQNFWDRRRRSSYESEISSLLYKIISYQILKISIKKPI